MQNTISKLISTNVDCLFMHTKWIRELMVSKGQGSSELHLRDETKDRQTKKKVDEPIVTGPGQPNRVLSYVMCSIPTIEHIPPRLFIETMNRCEK